MFMQKALRNSSNASMCMKIRVCPNCSGRLVADILQEKIKVRCNACGQELGTFDRADRPVVVNHEMELLPAQKEW